MTTRYTPADMRRRLLDMSTFSPTPAAFTSLLAHEASRSDGKPGEGARLAVTKFQATLKRLAE